MSYKPLYKICKPVNNSKICVENGVPNLERGRKEGIPNNYWHLLFGEGEEALESITKWLLKGTISCFC